MTGTMLVVPSSTHAHGSAFRILINVWGTSDRQIPNTTMNKPQPGTPQMWAWCSILAPHLSPVITLCSL